MQGKITIERYIEANERLNESMRSDKTWQEAYGFDGNTSDIDKVSDSARELGLTFTSAFEDAVIEGENFRGVLQGIFEDIQRILIRRSVTEPTEEAISGALMGSVGIASLALVVEVQEPFLAPLAACMPMELHRRRRQVRSGWHRPPRRVRGEKVRGR